MNLNGAFMFATFNRDKRHSPEDGATPLYAAAKNNHLAIVSFLLQQETVLVDAACASGATPLTIAARQGHLEVIQALVPAPERAIKITRLGDDQQQQATAPSPARSANVNLCEHDGWSPLLIACLQGSEDVVRHLVRAGADKHHVTKAGVSLASAVTRVRIQTSST